MALSVSVIDVQSLPFLVDMVDNGSHNSLSHFFIVVVVVISLQSS